MARCVTHILETVTPQAGALTWSLRGLFAFQRHKGWDVHIVSSENVAEGHAAVEVADLVHVHGIGGATIRHVWPQLKASRKRYLVSTYGMSMPRPHRPHRWRNLWAAMTWRNTMLRKAWCLHALVEAESDHLKQRRRNRRVKVLPMGIDFPPGETRPRRFDGKRLVLYLGALHPSEGLVAFLKAAARVADRFDDLHLVLAGRRDSHWTGLFEAGIRRQGFEDRVTLIPAAGATEIEALLSEAVLLVAPVPGLCCPVAPLQALAGGTPVLISPGCNLPEVESLKAGWVVEPTRRELQRALHDAFSHTPADLEAMGRRGVDIIRQRYSWDRLGHEYLNLYARVMGLG